MNKAVSYIVGFIALGLVYSTIGGFKNAQTRARLEAQKTEQARQETAVLQMVGNATQFATQQQAAEARAQAERNARVQEIADGVAAGTWRANTRVQPEPNRR